MSCVLSGLLEGFLQDRRAWLQSGEGASHLDDFFFFFLSECITISLEVPSVHQGHAIHCVCDRGTPFASSPRKLQSRGNKDKFGCHVKDKRCDFCEQ